MLKKFIHFLLLPTMIIPVLAYMTSSYKDRLAKDVLRFWDVHYKRAPKNIIYGMVLELFNCIEFRNLFFYRCGSIGRKLSRISLFYLPTQKLLFFGVDRSKFLGGVFIQHGYCTVITAQSIGENFWVNQNVTIAFGSDGCPVIGNNCHIASGAIVAGNITLEDNVTIGAGTTVVRSVPANTLVVSQKPRYIDKLTRNER